MRPLNWILLILIAPSLLLEIISSPSRADKNRNRLPTSSVRNATGCGVMPRYGAPGSSPISSLFHDSGARREEIRDQTIGWLGRRGAAGRDVLQARRVSVGVRCGVCFAQDPPREPNATAMTPSSRAGAVERVVCSAPKANDRGMEHGEACPTRVTSEFGTLTGETRLEFACRPARACTGRRRPPEFLLLRERQGDLLVGSRGPTISSLPRICTPRCSSRRPPCLLRSGSPTVGRQRRTIHRRS